MKWVVNMFKVRLLSCLSQPVSWLFVVLAVILSLLLAVGGGTDYEQRQIPVAVVIEDEGMLHERLLDLFSQNPDFDIQVMPRDDALSKLESDQLDAVFVIRPNFTRQLQASDFRNTIELYASPASSTIAALSEPIINNTLMMWIEEAAVQRTGAFLTQQGVSFTEAERVNQQEEIRNIWNTGLPLEIRAITPAHTQNDVLDWNNPISSCARWYGFLCVFYIMVGAGWVIDIKKKGVALRLQQSGARMWQLLVGAGMAAVFICMLGWILTLVICSIVSTVSLQVAVGLILSMLLYLVAVLGAAILLASLFRNITGLMLLAPIATFVNAVFGGLLARLPEWAAFLETISLFMPGRWLNNSITSVIGGNILPPAGLVLCCLAWLVVGCIAGTPTGDSS